MAYDGSETISVHLVPLKSTPKILEAVSPGPTSLGESTRDSFCERALNILQRINQLSLCVGANDDLRREVWGAIPDSYVDNNIFKEDTYKSTCRSTSCEWLLARMVKCKKLRCSSCSAVLRNMRRRVMNLQPGIGVNNRHFSNEEAMKKLQHQQGEIRKRDKKIAYLTKKLNTLLEDAGVDIVEDLSEDLQDILAKSNLSPMQEMFLQEQVKMTNRKDARGHRWHPTMIKLAHLYMKSRSAYEALRDSGAVKLPSSRTLHDYSRAFEPQAGVNEGVLGLVSESVAQLKPHQQYVNLLVDEVHASRNLVYRQSDGVLVGYTHLDQVEDEMSRFQDFIHGGPATQKIHLANTVLAYMAKGETSGLKHCVAAFPCNALTTDMLFSRTWHVISRLERVGVEVLSVTSDGCSVNRTFINMHDPITKTKSGVVFDTFNFCSKEERPLYFVADVAHLLKTIRNCFYNSGEGPKKTRCMEINGEKIVWNTIVGLYVRNKTGTLRKSHKLNAQNVFPNSYSCMKVRLAAEVLSETVALDIEQTGWANKTKTVKFIRMVNKFFDCLNGTHASQWTKTRNEDLKPYSNESGPRYDWLENTFKYIQDWKEQVEKTTFPKATAKKEQEKRMLSHQTREGIEIAIRGFTGATRFLIGIARKTNDPIFIHARAFSQDHLENYFSRQRGACGGSRNPNVSQFLGNQVSISIQRGLGIPPKRGNVHVDATLDALNEPLPKRKRKAPTKVDV